MEQRDVSMTWEPDKPHEECGVFGIYDFDGNDVASTIYYGLFALQHRGQESCGIAVSDTKGPRKVDLLKGMGLVNEVFASPLASRASCHSSALIWAIRRSEILSVILNKIGRASCRERV